MGCECTPVADDWEARFEGRQPDPKPGEVTGPAFLASGDEWASVVVCTGCGEIRQID
jgi:hypothetical protein